MELTTCVILFPSWVLQQPWPEVAGLIALPYLYIAYQRFHHRRENEIFRVVSENAADLIALVEVTGKRLYNSPAYEKVLGYSPKELAATASLEQVHPEDRERVNEAAKQAGLPGAGRRLEYRMRHKDGTWRHVPSLWRMRYSRRLPAPGSPACFAASFTRSRSSGCTCSSDAVAANSLGE